MNFPLPPLPPSTPPKKKSDKSPLHLFGSSLAPCQIDSDKELLRACAAYLTWPTKAKIKYGVKSGTNSMQVIYDFKLITEEGNQRNFIKEKNNMNNIELLNQNSQFKLNSKRRL